MCMEQSRSGKHYAYKNCFVGVNNVVGCADQVQAVQGAEKLCNQVIGACMPLAVSGINQKSQL